MLARSVVVGLAALAALTAAACTPARATPAGGGAARTVLVELFTSQGCSSCPAADALVRELPALGLGRDRVVPLTFHVDYWDRLGWPDPFASPSFTARQRRYAQAHLRAAPDGEEGLSGLYTPQMIVDGRAHFSGARRELALAEIARAAAGPPEVALAASARAAGDEVTVTARLPAGAPPPAGWRLVAALAQRDASTQVARGENAGERLLEAAVVRALSPPVAFTAGGTAQVTLRKPPALAWGAVELAAFVQAESLRVMAARAVPIAGDGGHP